MQEPAYTAQVTLRNGLGARVRPLQTGDAPALAALFLSLSPATKRLYGPHPFDQITADLLCASIAQEPHTTRFVAVLRDGQADAAIIGYMILTRQIHPDDQARHGHALDLAHCAAFAPCIADAYQDQGIGTQMARHVLASGRQMGLRQVILMGGVQARNARGRHFYQKLGFRPVGEFWTHGAEELLNISMVNELSDAP
jgi:RimJ/RimL family protein N-acetyltransferase